MTKKSLLTPLLLLTLSFGNFTSSVAQSIAVLPNPNAPGIFAWTGGGALSGYTGTPIILNNSLVLEYNSTGTSDLAQVKQQLAVYKNGSNLSLIANPDGGQGVYFQSIQLIFNNKLFFIYLDAAGVQRLASFDGVSITLYPNPDASTSGFIGSPRIMNNNLYVAYQNVSGVTQFGRFNGTGITLIPNPDNSPIGFFNNYSYVFNNTIVSRYVTVGGPKNLAIFNGTQWTILPNPDNTTRGVYPVFPYEYHGKLYFTYYSSANQYQYLKYDGISNPTLIPNPQNSASNNGGITGNFQIIANDTLFLQYYDINNVYRLAKFDGTSLTLVPNPAPTTYGYWYTPVVYNNKLFILYLPADGSRHLAEYQPATNSLKVITNPDAGAGYWDQPIVYGSRLYIRYSNSQSKFQLGSFDGNSLQLIPNPTGIYNSSGNNGYLGQPVVWNNILYMQMGSVPYGYAGNLASFISSGNGICTGNDVTFTSDVSGASYQWQVDNGTGSFTNLSNGAPYSNVTGVSLNLTSPSTSLAGLKYRCFINGNTYSSVSTLQFSNTWTGTVSTAWETAANWSCGVVPDANTDAFINVGTLNTPIVNSMRSVKSIHLQTGATILVANNQHLILTGK